MIGKYLPRFYFFSFFVALLVILTMTFATAKQPSLNIHGTTWDTYGKAKAEIKHKKEKTKTKGPMWVDIYFGAQGGLAFNQFLAVLDDGEIEIEVRGTFKTPPGKKSKTVEFKVFKKAFAEELEDFMNNMMPGSNFEVSVKKAKGTAQFGNKKSGNSIKFKFQTTWKTKAIGTPGKVKSTMKCLTKGQQEG